MDPEYKKALVDWIIAKLAGKDLPKPVNPADNLAVQDSKPVELAQSLPSSITPWEFRELTGGQGDPWLYLEAEARRLAEKAGNAGDKIGKKLGEKSVKGFMRETIRKNPAAAASLLICGDSQQTKCEYPPDSLGSAK